MHGVQFFGNPLNSSSTRVSKLRNVPSAIDCKEEEKLFKKKIIIISIFVEQALACLGVL